MLSRLMLGTMQKIQRHASDEDVARLKQLIDAEKARLRALIQDSNTTERARAWYRLEYTWLLDAMELPDPDFIAWVARQDPDLARRIWD